jgi:uncharacterized protein YbjT (DUF2867 family)
MSARPSALGKVLVVGASGRHGGTGRVVLEDLRAAGVAVRALARTDDDRAASLRAANVDVVVGDLHDRASMLRALDGCAAAYFTYPVGPGVVEATASFASAARDRGIQRIVSMSMGPSHPLSPSPLGRAQWLAEEVLQWSGVPCTILRVFALFFENLVILHSAEIHERSEFSNCFGSAAVPWIAGEDAARLAVAAILRPERFPEVVARFPGVEQRSHDEIADMLTRVLGRRVVYRAMDPLAWADGLRVHASQRPGVVNDSMAAHITTLGAGFAAGRAPTFAPNPNVIRDLIGREPVSFEAFLALHEQDFAVRSC